VIRILLVFVILENSCPSRAFVLNIAMRVFMRDKIKTSGRQGGESSKTFKREFIMKNGRQTVVIACDRHEIICQSIRIAVSIFDFDFSVKNRVDIYAQTCERPV
jgi:hypothetical protein